jgi:hypothetical protein
MGFTICILFVLYKIKLFWNQMEIFGFSGTYKNIAVSKFSYNPKIVDPLIFRSLNGHAFLHRIWNVE